MPPRVTSRSRKVVSKINSQFRRNASVESTHPSLLYLEYFLLPLTSWRIAPCDQCSCASAPCSPIPRMESTVWQSSMIDCTCNTCKPGCAHFVTIWACTSARPCNSPMSHNRMSHNRTSHLVMTHLVMTHSLYAIHYKL